MPGVVTASGPLNLDHVGTHVGQMHGAQGSGQNPREVSDYNPIKRSRHSETLERLGGLTLQ